jgi:hypothetical protein
MDLSVLERCSASMSHPNNPNFIRSYQIRDSVMKFFKRPPGAIIISLEFIGGEHFRLSRQLVRNACQFINNLPGILMRILANIIVRFLNSAIARGVHTVTMT